MLIKALCDYYDILSDAGNVLPDGYSKVKIHYLVSLTEKGEIDEIISCQKTEKIPVGKDKIKERKVPARMLMPLRTKKTATDANIAEHRALYLFGLNMEGDRLTPNDRTNKAKKSHDAFVKANLNFIDGLDTPVVNAYRNFLINWNPQNETKNPWLLGLGKEYEKLGYAFCLSGNPDKLLHDEPEMRKKWEEEYTARTENNQEVMIAQCAIIGEKLPIEKTHDKIKGIYGGSHNVLIGFNNESEWSYGNKQSYNSNVSKKAMKKYTEALNYLLDSNKHKVLLDDLTVVFWAMNKEEVYEDLFMSMLLGQSDRVSAEQTEQMLREIMADARQARIAEGKLQIPDIMESNVDFYMLGLKPNSSRISVKFIFRKKYAEVLWNIARFQKDLQITKEIKPVSLSWIKKELISPKSKNEKVSPSLISGLFKSIIYGGPYPVSLLETMIRRVKTDSGNEKLNAVRVGVIKACINRNYPKEELKVALDKTNFDQAYLCGRLFAILEKLQQEASNNSLNRTIKDAYFASASSKPALVFPKLIRLAQNHLNKVKYPSFYNKQIGEIIEQLNGEFPETLFLKEQGKFIVGYYQQYQSFFEKTGKNEEMEEK